MSGKYELVKQYLYEMELPIISEDPAEELVVVEDQERGVNNLIIDCEFCSVRQSCGTDFIRRHPFTVQQNLRCICVDREFQTIVIKRPLNGIDLLW